MRGIKPDFWTDEDVVEVSAFARLLFVGLWQMACDNGHVKDSPKRIKMSILPADDVDIQGLLAELVAAKLIDRSGGWIVIPNLTKHQRIDLRYFLVCDLDGCAKPAGKAASDGDIPAQHTQGTRRGHGVRAAGPRDEGEGEGEGENNSLTGVGDDKTPAKPRRGCRLPPDFIPSEAARKAAIADAPTLDLRREHARFVDYYVAAPGQRGVKLDWDATWRNWMRKAADQQPNGKSRQQQATDDLFDQAAVRMGVINQPSIEGAPA